MATVIPRIELSAFSHEKFRMTIEAKSHGGTRWIELQIYAGDTEHPFGVTVYRKTFDGMSNVLNQILKECMRATGQITELEKEEQVQTVDLAEPPQEATEEPPK